MLEHQDDFRVVAEADNAANAYRAFTSHEPDVVVMDISMPGASGLEAIRNIRARDADARILVFSMHSEAAQVKAAFGAGALRLRHQGQRAGRADCGDPRGRRAASMR